MAYNSIILRLELDHGKVNFGDVASAISRAGGDITSIDVIRPGQESSVRDITVNIADQAESQVVIHFNCWTGFVSLTSLTVPFLCI